jgi:cytoskeletal protein RodZ
VILSLKIACNKYVERMFTMKQVLSRLSRNLVRISMVMFASLFLLLGVANPAMAFGNASSSPSEGTTQMNNLQETSERALQAEPRSQREVQNKAKRGPNEVQGDADLHTMNSPADSQSATTVQDQIENALEKITPGN